jgi:hypothetical protein
MPFNKKPFPVLRMAFYNIFIYPYSTQMLTLRSRIRSNNIPGIIKVIFIVKSSFRLRAEKAAPRQI